MSSFSTDSIATAPQRPRLKGRAPRFRMARTIMALMLREMATTFGKSAGGYIWAVAEPVLALALLSFVFGFVQREPAIGTVFPLFYATGYLPFTLYLEAQQKASMSLRYSRPFLAYPNVTFVDAILARSILNTLTHIAVMGIVFGGIVLIYHPGEDFDLRYMGLSVLMAAMLGLGIGTLNCYLITAYPIWERVWSILNRPLFLMSGVFFMYGDMPNSVQHFLWYNPLIHVVGMMRKGVYATYNADYVSFAFVLAVSMVTLVFGLLLMTRHYRTLMER